MSDWIDDLLGQLHALADKRKGNELVRKHLRAENIHVYVRLSARQCGERKRLQCLILADITMPAEHQAKGRFTELLRRLEDELPALGVQALVVENIINPRFLAFLDRQGYRPTVFGEQTVFKGITYEQSA